MGCASHREVSILAGIVLAMALASGVQAAQVDITGPTGSGQFGYKVVALPNGNFIVTDPQFSTPSATQVGAIYLYSPSGNRISVVTGSSSNDRVGDGEVLVVGGSNAVVASVHWNSSAGAVTWIDGSSGLNGQVSAVNSLVGSHPNDDVGSSNQGKALYALPNGHYVVCSPEWANGSVFAAGAATWGDGGHGVAGAISAANSLVGTSSADFVCASGLTVLSNGNYVVKSPGWHNGAAASAGAATWADGNGGTVGAVSPANSLVGSHANDGAGNAVFALTNGNYVVCSPAWQNSSGLMNVGAVTWGNGSTGMSGAITAANSLTGSLSNDDVGDFGVVALSNGNYVVKSASWNNGAADSAGAATWGNGLGGTVGIVSAANSLVGSSSHDDVGIIVKALTNGNYVVGSYEWSNGAVASVGALTWGDGTAGIAGPVSTANSFVGTEANDRVGVQIAVLSDGNFVVGSNYWSNGPAAPLAGAITWRDGSGPSVGQLSAANSLVGTNSSDGVGYGGIAALSNGGYVVSSPHWNGSGSNRGAVTWGSSNTPAIGAVSAANSLTGSNDADQVGGGIWSPWVVGTGNYIVASPNWLLGTGTSSAGAVTWVRGDRGLSGPVSSQNSLTGSQINDRVGAGPIRSLADGNFLVYSPYWSNGAIASAGAVTLASGKFRVKGVVAAWNSVLAGASNGGVRLSYDYDATRHRMVVGRRDENIVSLFTPDQIFADDFEP